MKKKTPSKKKPPRKTYEQLAKKYGAKNVNEAIADRAREKLREPGAMQRGTLPAPASDLVHKGPPPSTTLEPAPISNRDRMRARLAPTPKPKEPDA